MSDPVECPQCGTKSMTHDGKTWCQTYGCPPVWQTNLPFEIAAGDGALLAKALRAYRPETSEEEGIVQFFIEQFAKLDQPTTI